MALLKRFFDWLAQMTCYTFAIAFLAIAGSHLAASIGLIFIVATVDFNAGGTFKIQIILFALTFLITTFIHYLAYGFAKLWKKDWEIEDLLPVNQYIKGTRVSENIPFDVLHEIGYQLERLPLRQIGLCARLFGFMVIVLFSTEIYISGLWGNGFGLLKGGLIAWTLYMLFAFTITELLTSPARLEVRKRLAADRNWQGPLATSRFLVKLGFFIIMILLAFLITHGIFSSSEKPVSVMMKVGILTMFFIECLGLAWMIFVSVARPLGEIGRSVDRLSSVKKAEFVSGSIDQEFITAAVRSFNAAKWIVKYRRELEVLNRDLGKKVDERNHQLSKNSEILQKEINERKWLDEQLVIFKQFVENASLGFGFADLSGNIVYMNKALYHMLGEAGLEDVIGKNIIQYYAEELHEELQERILPGVVKEGQWIGELPLKSIDDKIIQAIQNIFTIKNENNKDIYLGNVITDISDQKLMEKKLIRTKEAAEAANRAKSKFLANMSHEIRTPMNGIIGMTGLILEGELKPQLRDSVETIHNSAYSLLSLINDILDFSKIEAGQLSLEHLNYNLHTTVEEVVDMLAVRAYEKALQLSCMIHPDVPSQVFGDPGRLKQILINLIGNAIKFTEIGEIFIRVTLQDKTDKNIVVKFSITDTGIGIPAYRKDLLFKSFSQVDTSITRKYGGTGLGLAISKMLAENMGGEIGAESVEGKGSEFWFTVVLKTQSEEAQDDGIDGSEDMHGKRILIVDGHAANRQILQVQLSTWGISSYGAENGERALAELENAAKAGEPYHVALIDVRLPRMSGKMLARQIKNNPAIAMTKLVMQIPVGQRRDPTQLEEFGFVSSIYKPIKISQLYNCLASIFKIPGYMSEEPSKQKVAWYTLSEDKKRRVRILIAEDNIVNQKVALRMLENLGYRADAVADGQEAVNALESIDYDLVLMDVQMPEMNGFEATRVIRDKRSHVLNHDIPVIALTAHAMKGDREVCLKAGMNDYISKPVEPDLLNELICKNLDIQTVSTVKEPEKSKRSGVEIRRLQELVAGNKVIERELIDEFLELNDQMLAGLESAINSLDADKVRRDASIIKGSSGNIGVAGMQKIACQLEQIGSSGNLEQASDILDNLKLEFEHVRNYLENYLDQI